ncbi:Cro/CI family transcriptional regulator [Cupriavidus sp. CV2]|uniref:Cro/CI family transcriptional regulator n=1 Tax=Cupriavidus ulmosensis TaxID=3065913 RepID=UPI00296B437E|nr:Cro/CI family transcriptional regulator [Cupriavidus sp. CV2]MDW3683917.1 Cro/CI family transcriptional regulator [Cupriavidus sp. CV2]
MATATELIECLGGTGAVAKLLGIKAPSVSDWKKTGIPRSRISELALATGRVPGSLDDLSPERWHVIWPELGAAVAAQ